MGIWTNTKLRIAKDKGLDPRNLNDDEEKQVRMATKKLFGSGVAGAYIWVADTCLCACVCVCVHHVYTCIYIYIDMYMVIALSEVLPSDRQGSV